MSDLDILIFLLPAFLEQRCRTQLYFAFSHSAILLSLPFSLSLNSHVVFFSPGPFVYSYFWMMIVHDMTRLQHTHEVRYLLMHFLILLFSSYATMSCLIFDGAKKEISFDCSYQNSSKVCNSFEAVACFEELDGMELRKYEKRIGR